MSDNSISLFEQFTSHIFQAAPYLSQFSILYIGFTKDLVDNEKKLVPRFSVDLTPFQLGKIPYDYQITVEKMMNEGNFTTTQELLHFNRKSLEELIELAAIDSGLIYINRQNDLFSEYLFTNPDNKSLLKNPFISPLSNLESKSSPFNQALSRFKS